MPWKRGGYRRLADLLVQALNAHAYDDIRPLLTDDFIYLDTMGSEISGPDGFIDTMRLLHQKVPDFQVELHGCSAVGGSLLVTGLIHSDNPDYASDSLWRVEFAGERMRELQAFRENNAASMSALIKRERG